MEEALHDVALYFEFGQPDTSLLHARLRQSDRLRESVRSLGWCPRNRQQSTTQLYGEIGLLVSLIEVLILLILNFNRGAVVHTFPSRDGQSAIKSVGAVQG